jgi:transcriptional regulator with XRE-family HTH domain
VATPSIRLRLVGGALRRYRDNAGYRLEDVADVLEWDRSKISRIESGIRGIRPKELRELLTEYGVSAVEQEALLHLARRPEQGWWDAYENVLAPEAIEYIDLESASAEIMIYEPQAIPGLLQTPQYAQVIAAAGLGRRPADDDAGLVAAACELRQQLILDRTRQVSVVIGEAAIRQQAGAPELMAGQFEYLAGLAAADLGVTVQVVPFTAGAHAASGSTAFSLLRFGATPGLAVVFVPTLGGGFFVDSQEEVARYLRAFTRLRADALTVPDTVRLLREAAAPWD